jgi:diguanylate cyclase (GGDEF)-like protein
VEDAVVHGVLEVFTNYDELLDTSQRDRLTGLHNRYSLEVNLDRLWNLLLTRREEQGEDSRRKAGAAEQYWVGIIDIDYFKNVNDQYGHVIGDEVLILVARLLEKSFRTSGLLYRYGGEEFIVILSAPDLDAATLCFERARRRIADFMFPQVGKLTISVGFSGAMASVLPQVVINRADSALYEAKRSGRDRVLHYATLIKEGRLSEEVTGSIELF